MEITYTKHGDYYLPDLALPEEEPATYGRFSRMRLKYLKEHRRGTYASLLTSGQLMHHLNEIDRDAQLVDKTDGTGARDSGATESGESDGMGRCDE